MQELRAQLESEAADEGERKAVPMILCGTDRTLYGAMRPKSFKAMSECVLVGRGEENSKANRAKVAKKTIPIYGTHLFQAEHEFLRQQLLVTAVLNPDHDMSTCAKYVADKYDMRIPDLTTGQPYPDDVQARALFDQSGSLRSWSTRVNPQQIAN